MRCPLRSPGDRLLPARRHPPSHRHIPGSARCLVEVIPNGVTGARHTLPERPEPDFTLLDVPFQIGAEGPQPVAMLRDRVHGIDLSRAALILTSSKDLSLPGLCAAVVVARNKALLQHPARDRFKRMAMSGDPVGEVVMLFHASLLTVVKAPVEQTAKLVRIAQDSVRRTGLAALTVEETHRRVRDHLAVMAERFRRSAPDGQLLRLNLSQTPGVFQRGLNTIRLHARRPAPAPGLRQDRASP